MSINLNLIAQNVNNGLLSYLINGQKLAIILSNISAKIEFDRSFVGNQI
ncbi:unnamed protein product [Paramecium octaurelia]|uniref:Uncharacterized protein n=1 Tax=Paramecium octaurelia TaxID=43137 RepID=A0A8S1UPG9_PAROT|nr:unnamed protein product [Paramecium octaurelia]